MTKPDKRPSSPSASGDNDAPSEENKRVRKDGAGVEDKVKREQAVEPALIPVGDPAGAA